MLTTDFSISSVSPTPVAENSGTGIVFNFNRAGSAGAAVVTFHASGSANFAVGNPNPGVPTSADYTVTLGGTGAVTFNTTTGIGTVSFSSSVGDDNETVTIVPIGDTDIEGNETVTLTIDSVAGGGGAGQSRPLAKRPPSITTTSHRFPSRERRTVQKPDPALPLLP